MVDAAGIRNYGVYNTPDTTEVKNYRKVQEEPKEKVNFEGRKDYDSFEKGGESHLGRNIAIGSGIAAVTLYAAAALIGKGKAAGKYEWLAKNADKGFKKVLNTCVDKAYDSAKFCKKYLYTKPKEFITNLFNKNKDGSGAAGA